MSGFLTQLKFEESETGLANKYCDLERLTFERVIFVLVVMGCKLYASLTEFRRTLSQFFGGQSHPITRLEPSRHGQGRLHRPIFLLQCG